MTIFLLFIYYDYAIALIIIIVFSYTQEDQEVQQQQRYHLQLSRLDILILLSIFEDHRHKNKFFFSIIFYSFLISPPNFFLIPIPFPFPFSFSSSLPSSRAYSTMRTILSSNPHLIRDIADVISKSDVTTFRQEEQYENLLPKSNKTSSGRLEGLCGFSALRFYYYYYYYYFNSYYYVNCCICSLFFLFNFKFKFLFHLNLKNYSSIFLFSLNSILTIFSLSEVFLTTS